MGERVALYAQPPAARIGKVSQSVLRGYVYDMSMRLSEDYTLSLLFHLINTIMKTLAEKQQFINDNHAIFNLDSTVVGSMNEAGLDAVLKNKNYDPNTLNPLPVGVTVMGQTITPIRGNDQVVRDFLKKKAAKRFPDFIGTLDDTTYQTTGQVAIYPWNTLEEDGKTTKVVELLIVEVKAATATTTQWVGSWDLAESAKELTIDGSIHSYVAPISMSGHTTAQRDEVVATAISSPINFVVKSGKGYRGSGKYTRFLKWAEKA